VLVAALAGVNVGVDVAVPVGEVTAVFADVNVGVLVPVGDEVTTNGV
jgi:hypothetical protein